MRRRPRLIFSSVLLAVLAACAGAAPTSQTRAGAARPAVVLADAASPVDAAPAAPVAGPGDAPHLAPGMRAAHASLFGTDVIGAYDGAALTPDAAPGSRLLELDPHVAGFPHLRASDAVSTALSPDGKTLAVLTSGYNVIYEPNGDRDRDASGEWVFFYDVTAGMPRQTDVVGVVNAFGGLAFHPSGDRLFVSGGADDSVVELVRRGGRWDKGATPMPLGHLDVDGLGGDGLRTGPYAAGLAVSASGARLVVANHENDSVTILDTAAWLRGAEVRLPPKGGGAGGTFPSSVVVLGEKRAFVTCQRDREVVEVDLDLGAVVRRIKVGGAPTKIIANRAGTRLFVANANTDSVSVVDPSNGTVAAEIETSAPGGAAAAPGFRGSNPNALALSPDEHTLYVTNGGDDTVAVIALSASDRGDAPPTPDDPKSPRGGGSVSLVSGLVPTGLYPNAVTVSQDGRFLYVANGKSITGPNLEGPWSHPDRSRQRPYGIAPGNQFALQLSHAGLLAAPVPGAADLEKLTAQAILNNRFAQVGADTPPIFRALRGKVKHVVFVVGENRTYDQIFGDLAGTEADPRMVHWGAAITPNHHALARGFVTLDHFFDSGGVSGDGWQWTMGGRTTDVAEKEVPIEYGGRGEHAYDWEGTNRNLNMGLASLDQRRDWNPLTPRDPALLPGTADVAAIDGPAEGGRGFLWDVAIAAGLRFRNYGAYCDEFRYGISDGDKKGQRARIAAPRMPADTKLRVSFPTKAALVATTDPYFRGFDMKFADLFREEEWARELALDVKRADLPALEIVRLPHDHFGSFGHAADGVDTPDTQMADHDYALGLLVEKLSKTPFWAETVVVKLEDDAQNGADHVDSHRSFAIFAGGHVRRGGALVATPYTTTSVLRTIELLLDLPALGQKDAAAPPMEDVFTEDVDATPFTAVVPDVLRSTALPLPSPSPGEKSALPRGDAAFWELATQGMDFNHVDSLPAARFNAILYCGLLDNRGCTSEDSVVAADDDGR